MASAGKEAGAATALDGGTRQQVTAYAGWLSAHTGVSVTAATLCAEIARGSILCQLVERFGRRAVTYRPEPQTDTQRLENLSTALSFLRTRDPSVRLSPEDLFREGSNYKHALFLCKKLVDLFGIAHATTAADLARLGRATKPQDLLLDWVRQQLPAPLKADVKNLQSFHSGLLFCHLVNARAGAATVSAADLKAAESDPVKACELAFAAASKKLKVPALLRASDFAKGTGAKPDELAVMAWLSLLKTPPQPPLPASAAAAAAKQQPGAKYGPDAKGLAAAPRSSGINPFASMMRRASEFSATLGAGGGVRSKVQGYEDVAARAAADTPEAARARVLAMSRGAMLRLPKPTTLAEAQRQIAELTKALQLAQQQIRGWEQKYFAVLAEKMQPASAPGGPDSPSKRKSKSGAAGDAKQQLSVEYSPTEVSAVLDAMRHDKALRAERSKRVEESIKVVTSRAPGSAGLALTVTPPGADVKAIEFKVEEVDFDVVGLQQELVHELVVLDYVKEHAAADEEAAAAAAGSAKASERQVQLKEQLKELDDFKEELRAEYVDITSRWGEDKQHPQNADAYRRLHDMCASLPPSFFTAAARRGSTGSRVPAPPLSANAAAARRSLVEGFFRDRAGSVSSGSRMQATVLDFTEHSSTDFDDDQVQLSAAFGDTASDRDGVLRAAAAAGDAARDVPVLTAVHTDFSAVVHNQTAADKVRRGVYTSMELSDKLSLLEQKHALFREEFSAAQQQLAAQAPTPLPLEQVDALRAALFDLAIALEHLRNCKTAADGDGEADDSKAVPARGDTSPAARERAARMERLAGEMDAEAVELDRWSAGRGNSLKLAALLKSERSAFADGLLNAAHDDVIMRVLFDAGRRRHGPGSSFDGSDPFMAQLQGLQQQLSESIQLNGRAVQQLKAKARRSSGGGVDAGAFLITPLWFIAVVLFTFVLACVCMLVVGPRVASHDGSAAGLLADALLACPPTTAAK